jgi:hypothetical protein
MAVQVMFAYQIHDPSPLLQSAIHGCVPRGFGHYLLLWKIQFRSRHSREGFPEPTIQDLGMNPLPLNQSGGQLLVAAPVRLQERIRVYPSSALHPRGCC